jgi:sugar phosphate isomerase/epimerase
MAHSLCLNTITIRHAPLEEKIKAAQAAGYQGIGLWSDEIADFVSREKYYGKLRAALKDAGLTAVELCALGGWMLSEGNARRQAHDDTRRKCEQAAEVGIGCVIACAAGQSGEPSRAVDDFMALCEIAREFEARLALEFLGGAQFVKDVATAWDIVQRADQLNGGLLVDTFHFHKGSSEFKDLRSVSSEKIFLVHVNDAPDLPREQLTDKHRVHVGQGALPLKRFFKTLERIGYAGFLSLELFNEDYWAMEPRRVAVEGMDAMQRFFEKMQEESEEEQEEESDGSDGN